MYGSPTRRGLFSTSSTSCLQSPVLPPIANAHSNSTFTFNAASSEDNRSPSSLYGSRNSLDSACHPYGSLSSLNSASLNQTHSDSSLPLTFDREAEALVMEAGREWLADGSHNKVLYHSLVTEMLKRNLSRYELLTRSLVYETLKNCQPFEPNFFLCRLLYLINIFGLQSRNSKHDQWETFPLHLANSIAHGKRIMIHGTRVDIQLIKRWLFAGLKNFKYKRPSSHNVHAATLTRTNPIEKIGLIEAFRSRDSGLDLAILGDRNASPFNHLPIMADGHHGSVCMVKDYGITHSAMLFGIENSAPLKCDQQGNTHGPGCTPKDFSAFFLHKFGSDAFSGLPDISDKLPRENTNCLQVSINSHAKVRNCLSAPLLVIQAIVMTMLATPRYQ